jgi:M6 family metalloprotease-like protein
LLVVFLAVVLAVAAPHEGDEFMFRQPDGSLVPVLVWGDEFFQTVESPDGFTLVRDADGWICYADLSPDGSEFVATGVRYMGPQSRAPGVQRKLRINRESAERKIRRAKEELGVRDEDFVPRDNRRRRSPDDGSFAPAPAEGGEQPLGGTVMGLAVLIDFPDRTSNITHAAMSDFFNRRGGVNGNTASGSVRDWFYDASNGQLDYTNKVTRFYRARNNKNNYDTGTGYGNVRTLLQEVFTQLQNDVQNDRSDILCGVSTETSGSANVIMATNVYYAGSPEAGWANGLWPHQGTYSGTPRDITIPAGVCGPGTSARTVRISRYQLTSLGTGSNPPSIGTTVHENGHMIMRWPDLYNYDSNNGNVNVVSSYCVMSSSNGGNPQQPNPHFRDLAGWIQVHDITNENRVIMHTANIAQTAGNPQISMTTDAYQFRRNAQESYYIEARRRVGRSSNIPGEGLIIWHVHTQGTNTAVNATRPWPRVKVIQSNNANSTLQPFVSGIGANAPFNATRNQFHQTSSPPAMYYDGTLSPIRITEVSQPGATMSFRIGSATTGPATYLLDVLNGTTGTGLYRADTVVRIGALPTNAAGRGFVRWSTDTLTPALVPANIYACTTTVRTVARNVSVIANYGRIVSLPGIFEADTFGFASGITSQSNTSATGSRIARGTAAGNFAEYVVNVETAGAYNFSYRVAGASGTTSPGRFVLRDVTNNVTFDTVAIPTGGTALRTIEGRTFNLSAGRAVWRLEILAGATGNINIDWIQADNGPRRYQLTVTGGTGSGTYIADTTVTIAAPLTNTAGRTFMRWNSADTAALNRIADVYACTTTIRTRDAAATVASVYARMFVLPGNIEADTFGLAQGLPAGQTVTGATGNRIARIRDSSVFAEYLVDVQDSGSYRLSYRLQTGTATAGRFRIRDMTNGGITLDSVIVPTSTSTTLQTVEGSLVVLRPGMAVWRFEALAGNYGIDWIGAEPQRTMSVKVVPRAPLTYDIRAMSSGNIKFSVPSAEHVSLRMYDVKGRMVAVLHDGMKSPGVYNVNLATRTGGIGQGMYIVRMRSGAYSKDVRVHYRR